MSIGYSFPYASFCRQRISVIVGPTSTTTETKLEDGICQPMNDQKRYMCHLVFLIFDFLSRRSSALEWSYT